MPLAQAPNHRIVSLVWGWGFHTLQPAAVSKIQPPVSAQRAAPGTASTSAAATAAARPARGMAHTIGRFTARSLRQHGNDHVIEQLVGHRDELVADDALGVDHIAD